MEKEKNKSNQHFACDHLAGCHGCAFDKLENVWQDGKWRFDKKNRAVGTSLAVWCCGSNSMAVLLPLPQKKEENQTARGWKHRGTGDCNGDRNVLDHGVDL